MAATFTLPEELTIYTAAELRTALLGWLNEASGNDEPRAIDGSRVLEADGAGVQLLVALHHSLQARDMAWAWAGVSDPLAAACRELGCATLLDEQPEGATS